MIRDPNPRCPLLAMLELATWRACRGTPVVVNIGRNQRKVRIRRGARGRSMMRSLLRQYDNPATDKSLRVSVTVVEGRPVSRDVSPGLSLRWEIRSISLLVSQREGRLCAHAPILKTPHVLKLPIVITAAEYPQGWWCMRKTRQ